MATPEQCYRIVILGAGFGGLTAAVKLAERVGKRRSCEIVLVDKQTHFLYRPWLYEVATGEAQEERLRAGVATPYEDLRTQMKGLGVRVEYQEVVGLDQAAHAVKLADGRALPYDDLIVSLGAMPDFYGIEGLEQHGVPMYTLRDALAVNRRLHELIEKKKKGEIPFIRVLVGGAGPTGVEFACEVSSFMRTMVKKKVLGAGGFSIEVIEASPRPLQSFHPDMSMWARTRLEKLGVKLLLDTRIKGAHRDHVVLAPRALKPGETMDMLKMPEFMEGGEKEVTCDLLVWCGGFKANPAAMALGLASDPRGRIIVDDTLRVTGQEHIWAIGDCAALNDPKTKRPVPQLAQGAIHQAELVARNTAHAMHGQTLEKYAFPHMHALVPMGGAWGVAEVYGIRFKGYIVWPVRLAADIRYFATTFPWRSAWKLIRAPLTTFRRNNL